RRERVMAHDRPKETILRIPFVRRPGVMLLVRRDDPLAAQHRVALNDLRKIRYIALPESTTSHAHIQTHLAQAGVHLTPTARVDDFDTAHVFVELGLGHAIVPVVHGYLFTRTRPFKAI